jgi:3-hydroxyisobutyrate dehydrogenase
VLTGAWPTTFRLALLDKDVGIAIDLIRQLGLESPLLDQVQRETRAARAALGEDADYLEPIRLREQRAGVEIRG